jgi:hypothetical protein
VLQRSAIAAINHGYSAAWQNDKQAKSWPVVFFETSRWPLARNSLPHIPATHIPAILGFFCAMGLKAGKWVAGICLDGRKKVKTTRSRVMNIFLRTAAISGSVLAHGSRQEPCAAFAGYSPS